MKTDWKNVDWTKRTTVIAREINITHGCVSRCRKMFAPETVRAYHGQGSPFRDIDWTMRDADIARQFKITRERARQLRMEAGVKPLPKYGIRSPQK